MMVRFLSAVVILMAISLVALYIIVIPGVKVDQASNSESAASIKGEQNKIGEITEKQDNKWIYQGFRADSLSKELTRHIEVYENKVDSLNEVLSEIKFDMDRMDEKFTQKDEKLELDISELSDKFDAYKRKTNRDFGKIKRDIKLIKEDLEELVKFLERIPEKYLYILSAPLVDDDGNRVQLRWKRKSSEQYVMTEKDGKPFFSILFKVLKNIVSILKKFPNTKPMIIIESTLTTVFNICSIEGRFCICFTTSIPELTLPNAANP